MKDKKHWRTADEEWKALRKARTFEFWMMLIFMVTGCAFVLALL